MKEIQINDIKFNPFELKDKWMLVTAAKADGTVNTMAASWGGFGVMWNKSVVYVVIRPQRYTKEFIDSVESFSLTFFDKKHLKSLAYLGKVSGRDENKIEKVGFHVTTHKEVPYFEEAEAVIIAKKLFMQRITEDSFLDKTIIDRWYPEKDFHYLYIAEITSILKED